MLDCAIWRQSIGNDDGRENAMLSAATMHVRRRPLFDESLPFTRHHATKNSILKPEPQIC
jgi:hypothetical protein